MLSVDTSQRKPIKLWVSDIEEGALAQARALANLPFIHKHVALMPDAHVGYGVPIGCVFAADNVIIPNAVGVDIGCGMAVIRLDIKEIAPDRLVRIMHRIRELIPVGFKHHSKPQGDMLMPGTYDCPNDGVVNQQWHKARKQLGTLGGGNHFIEFQKDEEGFIYIMVHSGSRNVGKQVADHYNKEAQKLNDRWCVAAPRDLAFLPISGTTGHDYYREMEWCVKFAKENRQLMLGKIMTAIGEYISDVKIEFVRLDIAHNFAAPEIHYGKQVMVHRKGATRAFKDELGIIPGSQGTPSYIVKGLGNKLSFSSCSHGAGRRMGRNAAKKTLSLKDVQDKLEAKGIIHSVRGAGQLDEAPEAYKDIEQVMKNQADLVEVVQKLTPIACIKG